jgi:transcriptional regulator with XRE-family HTH domain
MSPKAKRSVEAKARSLGISPDELVELAVQAFEASADDEAVELRALIDQINGIIPETLRIVDECHLRVKKILNHEAKPDTRSSYGADIESSSVARKTSEGSRASKVDRHVGARLRLRRNVVGLTPQQVAEAIGTPTQQLAKYEAGINRISAVRLYKLAHILNVPVSYFFDDSAKGSSRMAGPRAGIRLELAREFAQVASERHQDDMIELASLFAAS